MKTKTFVGTLALVLMWPVIGRSQETPLIKVTDNFQRSLMDLKQSVEKLTINNGQMMQQDQGLRDQLAQLRLQLGQTQKEKELLDLSAAKLKVVNESKSRQGNEMRGEIAAFNNRLEIISDEIKLLAQGIDQKTQEDAALTKQVEALKPIVAPPVVLPVAVEIKPDPRKEKLKLMKMIYDSKKKQEDLHGALLVAQSQAVSTSQAQALARKAFLQAQIKQAEAALAKMPIVQVPVIDNSWSEEQLKQMELELKNLQKNHDELAQVGAQLQKKNTALQVKPEERNEQNKLEVNIGELTREGRALRADLDDLRNKMVELDKRKTRLDAMLRQ